MQTPELPRDWTKEERLSVMTGIHEISHCVLSSPADPENRDRKMQVAKKLFLMIETESLEKLNPPEIRQQMIIDLAFISQ